MTIILIDKYPILRVGLSRFLREEFEGITILESDSTAGFIKTHQKMKADIIIYGINSSPHQHILSDLETIRTKYRKSQIVIYDEVLNPPLILEYLMAGVSGYLSKAASLTELLECLQAIMNEKKYIANEVIAGILNQFPVPKRQESFVEKPIKGRLTYRESEIANYLCDGYRTSWIAEKLDRKPSTISTIKSNIFKKFEVSNVMDLKKQIQLAHD